MNDDNLTLFILAKLMEQDTVNPPGNERRAALMLTDIFDAQGIPCHVQELGGNRANFVAEIGESGPILEFSGHLDVVPCAGEWQHEPLRATEEGDLIYGRGACDMKGGVAAMCAAAISLHREGAPLRGRLRLCFVADEEHANLGMRAFLSSHESATWTLLGEPTDLHVAVAHRGVARFYVDLHGHACHAALRMDRPSAVTNAARAIFAIGEMNERLLGAAHPVLPPPSIVVTQLQGYEKDNVVPGAVRLLTDFRILPGTTQLQARERLERALRDADISDYSIETRFYMPGGEIDTAESFVAACCEEAARLSGHRESPRAFDASCEQCFLVEAGSKALILGPGSLDQAHTVDEFVKREQLLRATQLYKAIALRMIGG